MPKSSCFVQCAKSIYGSAAFYTPNPCLSKLFPVASFGHTGYTGQSMFFNRKKDMYVVMLTNATRFSSKKRGFGGPDYENDTCRTRTELHNAIFEDLKALKLL